jgi:hypothetical protein
MRQLELWKSGALVANVPANEGFTGNIWLLTGVPYQAKERMVKFALGQGNDVTFQEWRWLWKNDERQKPCSGINFS